MIPWASPSPQSKWHFDRFSCFCTGYRSVSIVKYRDTLRSPVQKQLNKQGWMAFGLWVWTSPRNHTLNGGPDPFPLKFPLLMGRFGSHRTHDSLSLFELTTQTASRSIQLLLHRWPQSVPILYNGPSLLLSKLPLTMGDVDRHVMAPWTYPSPQPKRHLSRCSCFLQGSLLWQTDRQTDRQTTLLGSVNNRLHLCT